jgi:protocatechuate 3,4-dioxygenase beta subunit
MRRRFAFAIALLGIGVLASASGPTTTTKSDLPASAQAALAPAGEPGERLAVTGVVFESDGVTRVPGVKLHVYQTDASGYYSKGQDRDQARLSARMTTSADGRFRFTSIRPGHYAGGNPPPSHIHFELEAPDGRRSSTEMQFADDPVLPRADRDAAISVARTGNHFGVIQPVEKGKDGVWQARFDLKLAPRR